MLEMTQSSNLIDSSGTNKSGFTVKAGITLYILINPFLCKINRNKTKYKREELITIQNVLEGN